MHISYQVHFNLKKKKKKDFGRTEYLYFAFIYTGPNTQW